MALQARFCQRFAVVGNLAKFRIQDLSIVTYAVVYAWVSEEPRRNAAPIAFVHRCGAMMWIDFKWIRALPRDQVL